MKEKRTSEINFSSLTKDEKQQLKKKIETSVFSFKRRQTKRKRYGVGLSFIIFLTLSLGGFKYYSQNNSIRNYLKIADKTQVSSFDNVRLILNDKNSIDIQKNEATISYSKFGNQIKIGSKQVIKIIPNKKKELIFNTVVVPYGKRTKIELSDGTMVWLNSGSKLIYPVVFNKKKREVYLEGEGIFDVAHNKNRPFNVIAKNYEIEVLGTVFNVSNYPDEEFISTTLKSGSVQISYQGASFLNFKKTIKITPGISASYNKNTKKLQSKKIDLNNYFSWKDGLFVFKNDSLDYIMKKLSRHYNVQITIANNKLKQETFSGQLDINNNIEDVLKLIQDTSNFKFNNSINNSIIIN